MNTNNIFRPFVKIIFILLISVVIFFQFSKISFTAKTNETAPTEPKADSITYGWTQLLPLQFTIEYNTTNAWKSGANNYLILTGGRINNLISPLVTRVGLQPRIDTQLVPLPIPTEKAGGVIIRDSIYIFGGASDFSTNYRNTVFKLNLRSGGWIQKNNMPIPIAEITYSTVSVNDSLVYIAGGKITGGNISNYVLRYNPKTDVWSMATPLPITVYGGGLGVLSDSTLIFIGGRTHTSVSQNMYKGTISLNNPDHITWNFKGLYPAGPVYDPGCWGTKKKRAIFTGGAKFPTPQIFIGKNTIDSVYGNTYFYNDSTNIMTEIDIKPTPVAHSQVDGFVTPGGNGYNFDCYAPGGASSLSNPVTNKLERLSIIELTGLTELITQVPERIILYPNHPNPFNSSTKIRFDLKKDNPQTGTSSNDDNNKVILKVFDIQGKEIAILLNENLTPGNYEITFSGDYLSSGVYFYKLSAGEYFQTRKMLILK